jgi:hypothetical protein
MHLGSASNLYLYTSAWLQQQWPLRKIQVHQDDVFDWDAVQFQPLLDLTSLTIQLDNRPQTFCVARLLWRLQMCPTPGADGLVGNFGRSGKDCRTRRCQSRSHSSCHRSHVRRSCCAQSGYILRIDNHLLLSIDALSGGPGGSGVGQVLRGGKHVRTVLSAGPDADEQTAKVSYCKCSHLCTLCRPYRSDLRIFSNTELRHHRFRSSWRQQLTTGAAMLSQPSRCSGLYHGGRCSRDDWSLRYVLR